MTKKLHKEKENNLSVVMLKQIVESCRESEKKIFLKNGWMFGK